MSVEREYDPLATTAALNEPLYQNNLEGLQPSNEILLGRSERTNNFAGGIATVGPGENINTALQMMKTAGGGTVFLRPGTYVLDADIKVPGGVMLEGASRDNCIINCNTLYGVKIQGTDTYTTGTISATNGDATITGSGTTWTAAMVGQSILVDGFWYTIATFTDTTHLEISEAFDGEDLTGETYAIATVNTSAGLRRITIHNASGSGVTVNAAMEPIIDDLYIYDCGAGLDIDYAVYPRILVTCTTSDVGMDMFQAHGWKIDFSEFSYCTGAGINLDTSGDATFFDSIILANGDNGASLTDCYDIAFISNTARENTGHGFELVDGNFDLQFIATSAEGNTIDGFRFTANADRIAITTTTILNNGGYGINIVDSTSENNYIIAPSFQNNTLGDINDDGTNTTIISNYGTSAETTTTVEPINGSTTPVAVTLTTAGHIVSADANNTNFDSFIGFVKEDKSATDLLPEYLSGGGANIATGVTTVSMTANAGTARYLIVFLWHYNTVPTLPTSMTWNGNSLTKLDEVTDGDGNKTSIWGVAIGDSGTNQTADISMSGGDTTGNSVRYLNAVVYDNVDQSDAYSQVETTGSGTSSSSPETTAALVADHGYARFVGFYRTSNTSPTMTGFTTRNDVGSGNLAGDIISYSGQTVEVTYTGTNFIGVAGIVLNPVSTTTITFIHSGRIDDFSGLTPGSTYYVSNTAGAISTTPGATSVVVGKAITTSSLVIIQT